MVTSAPRAVFLRGVCRRAQNCGIPQLQFITVVDTSFVAQRQILMVQPIQLRIWWSMSLFAGFFTGADVDSQL